MRLRTSALVGAGLLLLSACSSSDDTADPAPSDVPSREAAGPGDGTGSDGDAGAGVHDAAVAEEVTAAVAAGELCGGATPATIDHRSFDLEDGLLVAVRCRDVGGEARTDLALWHADRGLASARVEYWTPRAWTFPEGDRTDDLHVVLTSTVSGIVTSVSGAEGDEGPGVIPAMPDEARCDTVQRWQPTLEDGVLRLAWAWREPCQTYLDQDDAAEDRPMTVVHEAGRFPIDPTWTYRTNRPEMAGKEVGFHPLDGQPGPGGSGCNPGSDVLPDGIWFAFVEDVVDGELVVDLACMHLDDTKYEVSDDDLDFAIVNDSPKLRTVPAHPDLRIEQILDHSALVWWTVGLEDWAETRVEAQWTWLYVNDGQVTEVHEMWWS